MCDLEEQFLLCGIDKDSKIYSLVLDIIGNVYVLFSLKKVAKKDFLDMDLFRESVIETAIALDKEILSVDSYINSSDNDNYKIDLSKQKINLQCQLDFLNSFISKNFGFSLVNR